jgi:hypothetical protein
MRRVPGEGRATERARWLAELSESLDEAQRLLLRCGIGMSDGPLGSELHLRIEGARLAVQALRLRPMGAFTEVTGPEWSESPPLPDRAEPVR